MTQTIDLTQFSDPVNSALANGNPCVLATVASDGTPDIGVKGSMMVFDKEHLAYWERTKGTHLANLKDSPKVAVLLFAREPRAYLRFFGLAEVHEEGPIREQIMSKTVQQELDRDPERKGYGVLIKIISAMAPPPRPTT